MQIFTAIFRALLSIGALFAVIYLGLEEAKTGQDISMRVYAILSGAVFGLNADGFIKILSFFKKEG